MSKKKEKKIGNIVNHIGIVEKLLKKGECIMNIPKHMNHYFGGIRQTMAFADEYRHVVDGRQYWHVTRPGSKILLVAHIDTVLPPTTPVFNQGRILAQGLDDRLGVYLAFALFGQRNDVDVLITDEEEKGSSTAELVPSFATQQYNMIVGLDRKDLDFVDYGRADDALIDAASEFREWGWGSFSDIDFFKAYHCGCINWGIGYHDAHGKGSYVKVDDLVKCIKELTGFLDKHGKTHFQPHEPVLTTKGFGKYNYDWSNTGKDYYASVGTWHDDDAICNHYCPPEGRYWDHESQALCRKSAPCEYLGTGANEYELCQKCGEMLYYEAELIYGTCHKCEHPVCLDCGIELDILCQDEMHDCVCSKCERTVKHFI